MEHGLRAGLADPSITYLSTLVESVPATTGLWLVIATILVLFMQAGFLLVEAGSVRSKNTINVSQKNVADLIVCGCAFLLVGGPLMFGLDTFGLTAQSDGSALANGNSLENHNIRLHFLYQFAFCATAATIISGAVAERMTFNGYIVLAITMSALIYPIFGNMVWGNALFAENTAWLSDRGFMDYAGSTVVHSIGGWAALAAVLVIGPRIGRFDAKGNVVRITGHSSVLVLLGVMILIIGWIGFNAGAAKPGSAQFSNIALNTLAAMVFGGAAGMVYDLKTNKGHIRPRTSVSAIIGGLVAITAGCAYVNLLGAIIIGAIGGLSATFAAHILLQRFQIDDPVDAIATHGFAGLMGTLLVAVFAKPEYLSGTRLNQFMLQAEGALIAFVWAFGVTFLLLKLFARFGMALRVSPQDEEIGLNMSEHGEDFDVDGLKKLLNKTGETISQQNLSLDDLGLADEIIGEGTDYDVNKNVSLVGRVIRSAQILRDEKSNVETRMLDFETVGNDWLFELNSELKISHISEKFRRVFGSDSAAMIGTDYFNLLRFHDTPLDAHQSTLLARKQFTDCRFKVVGLDKVERIFSVSGKPTLDHSNFFVGYRCRATDVTDIDKANSEITYLAHHDFLTGLKNRAYFDSKAPAVLEKLSCAIVGSVDLDGFKAINDSFGHQTGDALLKDIALRMTTTLGAETLMARFGGDEFVFIYPVNSEAEGIEAVSKVGQMLTAELCKPVMIDDRELPIGGSVGIALYNDPTISVSDLVRRSDMALYEAKKNGRRQWVQFTQELEDIAKRRKQLTLDMPAALENNEFYLEFQPQVDVSKRRLNGFEALVRWEHPTFGRVPPNDFIPIAEENGLIIGLGAWILRNACQTAIAWPSVNGENLAVSINVSPVQLFKQDFLSVVTDVLKETGITPNRLELELTEGALVHNPDEVVKILTELRSLGVRIAIDDFGTGYSSLSYLQRFPLDRLKVDQAFVKNITNGANDQRITRAIIDLGKTLGLNVIAEGVETEEQHYLLGTLGCDDIQGFLHSPPISATRSLQMIIAANELPVLDDKSNHDRPHHDEDALITA